MQLEKFEKSEKKSNHGGARDGSGRKKKKVKVATIKKTLKEHLSDKDIIQLVKLAKERAPKDPIILKFLLEQIFGKAPQVIKGVGENESILLQWEK